MVATAPSPSTDAAQPQSVSLVEVCATPAACWSSVGLMVDVVHVAVVVVVIAVLRP